MSSVDEIAGAFINHFFTTLNTNPAGLVGLYVSHPTHPPLHLLLLLAAVALTPG
jgi:hypothetical protein